MELKKDGDHEWHRLDGSIIKVHQDAMRSSYDKTLDAIGSSVGGLSTKIHAKVDSFGHLVNILITPGQVHESQVADVWANEYCEFFLADKAYDIDGFRHALTEIVHVLTSIKRYN